MLVPKITVRQKLDNNNQTNIPYRIENGKFLVQHSLNQQITLNKTNQDIVKAQQPKKFIKLQKMEMNNLSSLVKILPESLYQQEKLQSFQQHKKEEKKESKKEFRKLHKSSKKLLCKNKNQLTALVPLFYKDYIRLVQDDPQMTDEFCYLEINQHPYDLRVVDFHQLKDSKSNQKSMFLDKKEFITMSSRGITYFSKERSKFISLEDWVRQAKLYEQLKRLDFFKKYKIWKDFSIWKKYLRKSTMKKVSQSLNNLLFCSDKYLRPTLLQIRKLTLHLSTDIKYFKADNLKQTKKFQDFKTQQQIYRINQLDNNILYYEEIIKQNLIDSCKTSLKIYKEENRIPNQEDDQQDKPPMLVGDQSNKQMPYTQQATIKTHCKKLKRFIKLIDYLVAEGKLMMIINSTKYIKNHISLMNSQYQEICGKNELAYRGDTWLFCELTFNSNQEIQFNPDFERIKKMFEQIINKSVTRICKKHKSLLIAHELQVYIEKTDVAEQRLQGDFELQNILFSDELFKQLYKTLFNQIELSFSFVQKYGKKIEPYVKIYFQNKSIEINEENFNENEFIEKNITIWKNQNSQLQEFSSESQLGLFFCQNKFLKKQIKNVASDCLNTLYLLMPQMLQCKSKRLCEQLIQYNNKISIQPKSIDEFIEFSNYVTQFTNKLDNLTDQLSDIAGLNIIIGNNKQFMSQSSQSIKNKEKKFNEAQQQLISLRNKIVSANMTFDHNQTQFRKQVENKLHPLNKEIQNLVSDIETSSLSTQRSIEKILQFLQRNQTIINRLVKKTDKIQFYQMNLGLQQNQFESLIKVKNLFFNLKALYSSIDQLQKYQQKIYKEHFLEINLKEGQVFLDKLNKKLMGLSKGLEGRTDVRRAEEALLSIAEITKDITVIKNMTLPVIKQKQWNEIRKHLKKELGMIEGDNEQLIEILKNIEDPIWTLQYFKDLGIFNMSEYFEEVAIRAVKEAELQKMLKGVEEFWVQARIAIKLFKENKDIYILANNDQLFSKIDDNMLVINNILASRYVETFREQVQYQLKLFKSLSELIDQWQKHQTNWLYLEPIFNSAYSAKNLAKESKLFATADNQWKKIMKSYKDARAIKWATNEQALICLKNNNNTFELIQKALDQFLQKKREIFQRFFFLSNDQLLEILSQAKDIRSLEPFLRKCFQNIIKFKFESKSQLINGLISAQNQLLVLKNIKSLGGQVQNWLNNIQEAMKINLKSILRNSLLKYQHEATHRKEWVLEWPLQVVLTIDSTEWTKIIENDYLDVEAQGDLYDFYNLQLIQLAQQTQLIRGNLSDLQRKTLVALVTQDVHYRDIVEQLKNQMIQSIFDFKWQQQLRFYYNSQQFMAKQVNAELLYGYQYLGATTRLVITPLTDRCWMTITGALGIRLGAAPQGPAGTGKTQSCKDLSKALGRYCIVFNCSEQINVKMIQKLFLGISYTGSWICLDQFNRIDIEVLSVIAQQMLVIREALLINVSTFIFSGRSVDLNPDLGIFVTMNPGYAGRTQLPDNLKVLFRPVAMMVPDYALIAQIMLYAQGFANAKSLSIKMTKLYQLSSQQLSQQDHYDFGMRAVKSVLVMAGAFKRSQPNLIEDIVLIKAMRDSNIPKFLSYDLPLFNSIVKDLFPEFDIPQLENKQLQTYIKLNMKDQKLTELPTFITKVLQLHETMKVRFGVMLVGDTLGGKSKCIDILRMSYTSLKQKYKKQNKQNSNYFNILYTHINPKSISMEQLYGQFDPLTQGWTDGLASKIMREYINIEGQERRWVIFDGPVDALWVQNMNTVLDDSMTLCLSNGQRIKLKHEMKILFQVLDLTQASPATVSRCGMVYFDQSVVGLKAIIQNYFETYLQDYFVEKVENRQYLMKMFTIYFEKIMPLIRTMTKLTIKNSDSNLAISCCRNILAILKSVDQKILQSPQIKKGLDKLIMWSLAWGIGATIQPAHKNKVLKIMADNIKNQNSRLAHFDNMIVFDKPQGQYINWSTMIPMFHYKKEPFHDLFVPTQQTVCYTKFLSIHSQLLTPIFLTGFTGTGKSIIINNYIQSQQENISSLAIVFSGRTDSKTTQYQIENKMQVQRKFGRFILMPPPGKKSLVFIDDVNMPNMQIFGAQPPVELMRMIVGMKGIFDRNTLIWKDIENLWTIIAAAPPGGGRSQLTIRFTRFFNVMTLPDSGEQSMMHIFSSIIQGFLQFNNFKNQIRELCQAPSSKIISATIDLYKKISENLLPTPSKSHYVFNLRDVAKVFQGMMMINQGKSIKANVYVKLWAHQVTKVFSDRLIGEQDRSWCEKYICKLLQIYLHQIQQPENLFYRNPLIFINLPFSSVYELFEYENLLPKLNQIMNQNGLNVVLFQNCVLQLIALARVLRQERGHYMYVGVGGSGKTMLTKMGAIVSETKWMTIEMRKGYATREFREDLLKMMKQVAVQVQQKSVVFAFADSQVIHEIFLEDINNILNGGQVLNMFKKDDIDQVIAELGNKKLKVDPITHFNQQVKNHFHICLNMSPVGNMFRTRLRQFPNILNCCTINWLTRWPQEALYKVSMNLLQSQKEMSNQIKQRISKIFVRVHESVQQISEKFFNQLKRRVYVTPKSFIEVVEIFKELVNRIRNQKKSLKIKMNSGLQKMQFANKTIEELSYKLAKMQPILKQKIIEQQELTQKLKKQTYEVSQVKEIVQLEKDEVKQKTMMILQNKNEADRILYEAQPMLESALKALDTLNNRDIAQIKHNTNPMPLVRFCLQCVAILMQEKPDMDIIRKNLLSDPSFLTKLKNLKGENISKSTQFKIKEKLKTNTNFIPSEVAKINYAAKSLCQWVRAMAQFTDVWNEIEKRRDAVNLMNKQLQKSQSALKLKEQELNKVLKKVADLQAEYQKNVNQKNRLDQQIKLCGERLIRANDLTKGLADQQIRWKQTVEILDQQFKFINGNITISAASIAYYGPFTGLYREEMVDTWIRQATQNQIEVQQNYMFRKVLGNQMDIRQWNLNGLPSDAVSINNGILVKNCRMYPLVIDPQLQASKWLKKIYKDKNLKVLKMRGDGLIKNLQANIRMGFPVLIEDMYETLQQTLQPLLMKQFRINGSQKSVKLMDSYVQIDPNFQLFISTKINNPKFLPDIFIRTSVINFIVTQQGLQEQLLSQVVKRQMPEVEQERNELIIGIAHNQTILQKTQDKILELLAESKGMILDDVNLIENLKMSKQNSIQIKQKLIEEEEKSKQIAEARSVYKIVAKRGSLFFFVINDIGLIDPMYQFSLMYFKKLFNNIIENEPPVQDRNERIIVLINKITEVIYVNICRGLFNDHKKIFAFLLATKINIINQQLCIDNFSCLIRGFPLTDQIKQSFTSSKITKTMWNNAISLSKTIPVFQNLKESLESDTKEWQLWIQTQDDFLNLIPKKFNKINSFDKILLTKVFKEDFTLTAITDYICNNLGKKFISSHAPGMEEVCIDIDWKTPLIFILSQGADPLFNLLKYAKQKKIETEKISIISLGQGQGQIASRSIDNGLKTGGWVILQNCHLGKSFMPTLEKKLQTLEQMEQGQFFNSQFRLFLTSMPCTYFPISVLQIGLKITNQPQLFVDQSQRNQIQHPSYLHRDVVIKIRGVKIHQLFQAALFFSIFSCDCSRKKEVRIFGLEYPDFDTSMTILKNMLSINNAEIPWQALRYVIGQITYGGRVTDEWDRRLLNTIIYNYMNEDILQSNHSFSQSNIYINPQPGNIQYYKQFIESFPSQENPEVFGMNQNANITYELKEIKNFFETIVSIQPREGAITSLRSSDSIVEELASYFLENLPSQIKIVTSIQDYTTAQGTIDSLQVCLKQQLQRFNSLVSLVKKSLENLKKAIKGQVVMSEDLQNIYSSLINNQVPKFWAKKAYPSVKPLSSWYKDLINRVNFFKNWKNSENKQKGYWISAFFFPQGFITSLLQNFARKFKISIDKLGFSFKFMNFSEIDNVVNIPQNGAYIYGLFVQGCRFDIVRGILDDAKPGQMYSLSPVIHFIPVQKPQTKSQNYVMPVYKTTVRAGTLSTTGHSTNFIIGIECVSRRSAKHWILNGAAFVCSRDD